MPERQKRPAVRVLQAICAERWAITEAGLRTILEIAARENEGPEAVAARLGRPLDNTRAVTVLDGVATIPVSGPLFRYADFFTAISGAATYEELATDLRAALDDRTVRAIIFDFDSPGGEVSGLSELADLIYAARGEKPITAFISGQGCSAAYWLASACDTVIVSDTAIVGSIGVRTAYTDRSALDEAKGIRTIEIVSSQSPNKRMDPTEDAGRAQIQTIVDDLAQVFLETVARNRGVDVDTVLADFGQGGVFVGRVAVEQGLADAVGTYDSTHAQLRDQGADAVVSWQGAAHATRADAASGRATTTPAKESGMNQRSQGAGKAPASSGRQGAQPRAAEDEQPKDEQEETCPECGATLDENGKCPECGWEQGEERAADEDEEKPKEEEAKKAKAGADPIAQARIEERTRIATIRQLGATADAKLVEACINEGISADAAARRFLEASQAKLGARLDALRTDEQQAQHPAAGSVSAATPDADQAQVKSIMSAFAQVAPKHRLPTPTRS